MISSVVARAKELQAEGYDYEYIYDILQAQGTNKYVILGVLKTISHEHTAQVFIPQKYDDIYHIIESTIYSQPSKEIIKVLTNKTKFGQLMPIEDVKTVDLEYLINYCQSKEETSVIDEIHDILKPYINTMIVHLNMLATYNQEIKLKPLEQKTIDKYIEWFGLWSPEMQKAYNEVLKKEEGNSSEIHVVYDYNNREQTFCPMYETEINVDIMCRECPFFLEVYDEENNEIVKKCNFRK